MSAIPRAPGLTAVDAVARAAGVSMTTEDELALTERVGRELARLGLHGHVARVRMHYAAVRAASATLGRTI
jgi:hypothetical protein